VNCAKKVHARKTQKRDLVGVLCVTTDCGKLLKGEDNCHKTPNRHKKKAKGVVRLTEIGGLLISLEIAKKNIKKSV